jgi:type IV secretion system protein VirB9
MNRFLPVAALASFLSATAWAADARLASRLYDPEAIVRIEGQAGVQATIAFAEDEHIENVAIGDSVSWQVTPNKRANLLFVKPLKLKARTNMTVVTDRHTYFFDLVAGTGARPIYALRFTYPEAQSKPAGNPAQAALSAEEADAIATAGQARPLEPAKLNFAWRTRGKAALLPARVFDDGASTYLGWAQGTPLPAILVRNEKGVEGPVNFAVRDDVIVIDGVPALILLRRGKELATLENQAVARALPQSAAQAALATLPLPAQEP